VQHVNERRRASGRLGDERGGILVGAAITIVAFAMLGGAVLEVGSWFTHRRHLQLQTDAAALAAAPFFEDCILDPSGTSAQTDMKNAADQYGHFNGTSATYNLAVNGNGTTGGTVSANYNRLAYPAGSHAPDTDFTDQTNPCVGRLFDVKATETGIQNLFSFSPLATVNAHSRVEIFEENEQSGLLPIGVPDPRFQFAFASFINEATGSALSGCTIGGAPAQNCEIQLYAGGSDANGNQLWAPQNGNVISVPIGVANVGVRIRLVGGTDPTTPCGQLYTECYTDLGTSQGLVYVRGWDPNATPTAAPTAHNVWLNPGSGSSACNPDAYFAISDCSAGLYAEIDFGDRPVSGAGVNATVTATIAGGPSIQLTRGALVSGTTSTYLWSATTGLNVVGAGGHAVTLKYDWSQTSGTWRGNTCSTSGGNKCTDKGSLEGGNPVQRAFEGSFDLSGPLKLAQVYEPPMTSGSDSFQRGTTHSLGVVISTTPRLVAQTQLNDPLITLRVVRTAGGQTRTIDCDPAITNFRNELGTGCGPTYIKNPSLNCPFQNVPDLWNSAQPWPCVAVQTGASVGQFEQGIQDRVLGGANTCTAPIHWPYDENLYPKDPRVIPLLVTPFGTFTGSGSSYPVPVIDFGAFYVMGWDKDPCPGAVTNVPSGALIGHFIHFLNNNPQHNSTTHCFFTDPNEITPCVAVLTR
jgi:Flp pilus assembly protein TadG